ncbi:MAG: PfkB family carbohydrate kinase [Alphaproteobacteria bacterium]|jgi:sulfofructose kinase
MAEIICVGVAFLDNVFEAEVPVSEDSKSFARDHRQFGGGMAATAAAAVVQLGGRAALWGRLGDDEVGTRILDGLIRRGVQTDSIRRIPNARSPVSSVVIGQNGERQAIVFPGRDLDNNADWLPLDRISEVNALLVDPRWPEAAMAALERAREHHIPAILDADVGPDPVPRELVELATHAIFSHAGLTQFTGTSDIPTALYKARDSSEAVIGVTAGAAGFYWLSEKDKDVHHIPGLDVVAVDTLGAGDVFHGAFALAIGEGKDVAEAGRFANVAAGLKCAQSNGRDAIPSRAEVWKKLANETAA